MGLAAPGLPGQSILASTLPTRVCRSPGAAASAENEAGSRLTTSLGPPPAPPRPRPPPPRAPAIGPVAGAVSRNAYAPPGPARPPGQVGHGAPGAFTALVVMEGAAPRRAFPGVGVFGTSAISAPSSTAARCHAGRFASAT